jgi:RNA-directed DNA polymerase
MLKFLRHRIGDERVIRLIARMLKSGIMEDGLVQARKKERPKAPSSRRCCRTSTCTTCWTCGSAGVCRQCRGEAYYFRFADDFVACFQYRQDAEFQGRLRRTVGAIPLDRWRKRRRAASSLAGLRARTRAGAARSQGVYLSRLHALLRQDQEGLLQGQTSHQPQEAGTSLRAFSDWARRARHAETKGRCCGAEGAREGHLNYYAITDNARCCNTMSIAQPAFCSNGSTARASARHTPGSSFNQALRWVGWPRVRIRKDLNPCRRAEAR